MKDDDKNLSIEEVDALIFLSKKNISSLSKEHANVVNNRFWATTVSASDFYCFICNKDIKYTNKDLRFPAAQHGREHLKDIKAFL